ncbi:MAG: DUF3488 and transglutaminase-like domain-containing protein [Blastocatellia bacterium]|nr:DUF3488 and transglutaminase-like domain-containing protein [Blastocatellia bacterium]
MGLSSYYKFTSYALVATSFAAMALTGELDGISVVVYPVILGLCFYRDARGAARRPIRAWVWRSLALAYIPFFFLDVAIFSDKILALVHLTLFASSVKLFDEKRDRDWVFLYVVAFFQMLLAAGLTFDTTFVASLILFLFFFISTLAAFEIRRTRREAARIDEEVITFSKKKRERRFLPFRSKDARPRPPGRVRYLVGASLAQVVMVAALTLPFFFLIPRFGGGGVARGWGEGQSLTGFSERVELGDVAQIKESNRVVMRVELASRPGRFLRWRGIALDHYDGRVWSARDSQKRKTSLGQDLRVSGESWRSDDKFDRLHQISEGRSNGPFLEQRIVLEPVKTNILFAAQRLRQLRGPISQVSIIRDTTRKVGEDSASVYADSLRGRVPYRAFSDITVPSEEELRAEALEGYPEIVRSFYLQTPRLDPRIERLARDIVRDADARTPYDKARAIEQYLKTRFGYTLNLKPAKADPLAEFLFDLREGHCEYFATAMTIMLRTLGIPARIVNGFQMGEYNDVSDFYTVRDRDAHSWVEVYFPQSESWVEFDPTPAAGINNYSQGGLLGGLWKYMEALEVLWLDYVVTLDSDEQASLLVEIQQQLLSIKDRVAAYYVDAKEWLKSVFASYLRRDRNWSVTDALRLVSVLGSFLLASFALYVVVSHLKRRRLEPTGYGPWWHRLFILLTWRRAGRDHRKSAVLFYERMLAIAAHAGMVKPPDQTPVEFAALSGFDQVREITNLYNRVRFGGARLTEGEADRIANLLAELKKAVRRVEGKGKKAKKQESRR